MAHLGINITANNYLVPPYGYPLRLGQGGEYEARGVLPRTVLSIVAEVVADTKCDVHAALLCAPLLVDGVDSELILQVDSLAVTSAGATLTLTIPAALAGTAIAPTGTIAIASETQAVVGTATAFPLDGSWNGYELQVSGGSWYQIGSVTDATHLTLTTATGLIAAGTGAFYVRRPVPAAFVYRIWIDNIVGGTAETLARDGSITDIAGQPKIPGGLTVSKIVVG